ncbi:hypothetical protein PENFLA_c024G06924 [Penicillium flavigenum]|uniref:Uncharacterized protein n=1 Tax=Penicillium flavigenum TaxID=254877 RepID=A0A1V6SUE9_9EURO|nr:hypothetical protein PENFLA_c024G06924 [Penicillium flavigenum]
MKDSPYNRAVAITFVDNADIRTFRTITNRRPVDPDPNGARSKKKVNVTTRSAATDSIGASEDSGSTRARKEKSYDQFLQYMRMHQELQSNMTQPQKEKKQSAWLFHAVSQVAPSEVSTASSGQGPPIAQSNAKRVS